MDANSHNGFTQISTHFLWDALLGEEEKRHYREDGEGIVQGD